MISRSRVIESFWLANSNEIESPAIRILRRATKFAVVLAAGMFAGSPGLVAQTVAEKPYYIRFGGVVEYAKDTIFSDVNCDKAVYGCGRQGVDPVVAQGAFGTAGGFELGFGYRLAPGFRLEGIVQNRPPFKFNGNTTYTFGPPEKQRANAEVSTLSVMTAVFFDFAETISMPFGDFRPYFGSGVGFSRNEISETKIGFPNTTTTVPGGRTNAISGFFSVGIMMPVSETITLDIAWRYTDLGKVESDPGNVYVHNNSDGSLRATVPGRTETRGRLRSSGLAMSLIVPF